jgi:class 3 adenylate cyclase
VEGRTGYARSGDAHLAYVVNGTGPIDVLYMGGYMLSYESCEEEPHVAHMLRRLSSFSRLIRFDPRGIGSSDSIDPAHPPTPDAQGADILAVLDAVGSERAVLVGDAGLVGGAITLAATLPARVQALVLVNSAARIVADEGYEIGYPPEFVEQFLTDNTDPDTEWTFNESDDVDLLVATLSHDTPFREWWARASRRSASPATARAILTATVMADNRDLLPAITVPTLVVHSRRNTFVPSRLGKYLADHIPGAQFVALDTPDNSMLGLDADLYVDAIEEFLTGKRTSGAERVLATVLFTDIVDSTSHASTLGDRSWSALLDTHDAIVRAELARYGGREVNTTGDGFVSAFDSPTQAVRAAQAIVTGAAAGGLEVRVGIHTGECERRGNDLAGLAVHIAARVAATAEPGEVLVSRTVRDLVSGSELKLADRGEHELKGVAETWQLYALKP